ncbi:MAG: D-aminoacyl-tRNA deacylase [Desulfobulbus sp.]|jgi:D-tyrosyl-tRNA(Tyr) deacylase|nr:D-aminoacyl-tRNA deacylase [Desulfobulbus sp.]
MRAVLQRVSRARVEVEGRTVGAIDTGLLVLLGIHRDDAGRDVSWMVEKIVNLRIFDDEHGQMNRSLFDVHGALLVVSQFTLHGDCRKGRRPSWHDAAPPELARPLYEKFLAVCRQHAIVVETGTFQATMDVSLTNAGPVTMLLDSHKTL